MRSSSFGPLLALGLLAVAGCSSGAPSAAAPATTTTTAASATTAGTSPAPASSTAAGGPTSSSAQPSTRSTDGTPACTASDVTASLGRPPAPGGQVTIPLRYTDTGSRSCTLTGYPGATLVGPDVPQLGPQYQLPRSTATTPTTVTLTPGQTAVADLTLGTVAVSDPTGWQATELLTTAPDDTTTITVAFPAGTPVARQDSATRPATYVGPFTGPVS